MIWGATKEEVAFLVETPAIKEYYKTFKVSITL